MAISAKGYRSQIAVFLLPGMTLMLLFIYIPFVCALGYAFFDWDGYPGSPMKWVGLDNFKQMAGDEKLILSVWNVLVLVVTGVLKALIFPLLVAELIYSISSARMAYVYRVLFVLPMVVPGLVGIYIWGSFYGGEGGLINELLGMPLSLHRTLFGSADLAATDLTNPGALFQQITQGPDPVSQHLRAHLSEESLRMAQAQAGTTEVKGPVVEKIVTELNQLLAQDATFSTSTLPVQALNPTLQALFKSTTQGVARFRRNRQVLELSYPGLIAPVSLALIFEISDPLLSLAQWLKSIERSWLNDPHTALGSLVFMGFPWCGGVGMLIVLAGLIAIPEDVRASAILDGATGLRRIWHIDLPHLAGQIKLMVILSILGALQGFEAQFVLTNGGPDNTTLVPALHMYNNAFKYDRLGYGAAVAVVLFLVMVALTYLNTKLQRSGVED